MDGLPAARRGPQGRQPTRSCSSISPDTVSRWHTCRGPSSPATSANPWSTAAAVERRKPLATPFAKPGRAVTVAGERIAALGPPVRQAPQNFERIFNDAVMSYNTARENFPSALIAGRLGFEPAEHLEIDEAERAAPKISFG